MVSSNIILYDVISLQLNELSKAGVEGFTMLYTGKATGFVGTKYGNMFLNHQSIKTTETLAALKAFVIKGMNNDCFPSQISNDRLKRISHLKDCSTKIPRFYDL